jgi:hypothetical protein
MAPIADRARGRSRDHSIVGGSSWDFPAFVAGPRFALEDKTHEMVPLIRDFLNQAVKRK